ncbi:helix-turn-helix domain-containing protein [Loigolactobacillus jiayinensis]|uniref:Helix-turn-helix domain-containing protein n=1 Tax=Loigolactobacillus jiayinensis TaxID=2486016 RepID=A0ABW1RBP3_9LACO|nr:helix-turn-helix transcriptional regulator [Loigolactobacillus jiayinensis]
MVDEPDNVIAVTLGKKLARERKLKHLSQQQLAEDICSQSMISSIEKGIYIPNAVLLSRICTKLNLSMDHTMLSNYPEIAGLDQFNVTIKKLCNQHDYAGMLSYLNTDNLVDQLFKNEDLQTYYYYGVATEQQLNDTQNSLRYLRLAYNYTFTPQKKIMTPNEILILAGIAYLETKFSQHKTDLTNGFSDFNFALAHVENDQMTKYDENSNILYYQFGLRLLEAKQYAAAVTIITKGIDWTTAHASYYMLADLFLLLAKTHAALNEPVAAESALNKSQTIADIFKIETYKL